MTKLTSSCFCPANCCCSRISRKSVVYKWTKGSKRPFRTIANSDRRTSLSTTKNLFTNSHLLNQINQNLIEESLAEAPLRDFESLLLKQMDLFDIVPYTAWGNQQGEYVGIARLRDGTLHIEIVKAPSNPKYYTYTVNSQE